MMSARCASSCSRKRGSLVELAPYPSENLRPPAGMGCRQGGWEANFLSAWVGSEGSPWARAGRLLRPGCVKDSHGRSWR